MYQLKKEKNEQIIKSSLLLQPESEGKRMAHEGHELECRNDVLPYAV